MKGSRRLRHDKRQEDRVPLRCVLFAALLCAGAAAQPTLEMEWKRLLSASGATPWLTAVCPDGVFYASDARGYTVALSAKGGFLAESVYEPALVRARALVCDSEGRLYAAQPTSLAVLRVSKGKIQVVRELQPEVSIAAMTIGPRGRIFAVGRRPGSRLPFHVLEPGGRVLRSFGEITPPPLIPAFVPPPFLLWHERPERLLAISRSPYEIHAYSPEGALLEVVRPRHRGYIQPLQFPPGDITGVALLPRGRLALQHGTYGRETFLDLLDENLRLVARDVPAFPGALAGASSSGGLYFFDTRHRPGVVKASLKSGSVLTRVLAWNHEVFRVVFCCPVRDHRAGFGKVPG